MLFISQVITKKYFCTCSISIHAAQFVFIHSAQFGICRKMTSRNISARALREIVPSPRGEFVFRATKKPHVMHRVKFNDAAGCCGILVDFDVRPFAPVSVLHIYTCIRAPMVWDTKDSVPRWGNLPGTGTSALPSPCRSAVLTSSRHPSEPSLCLSSTGFANYPSPGTLISHVGRRARQEERDLNVFGPWGTPSRLQSKVTAAVYPCIFCVCAHTRKYTRWLAAARLQSEIIPQRDNSCCELTSRPDI